jgi:hypothetical protein
MGSQARSKCVLDYVKRSHSTLVVSSRSSQGLGTGAARGSGMGADVGGIGKMIEFAVVSRVLGRKGSLEGLQGAGDEGYKR